MSAQQPIVIPDSPVVETVELPVADPAPVLPDYEEVSVPTMEEVVLNWLTLEDAHVNRARVGDYIRTTSRIFQRLLYIEPILFREVDEVSATCQERSFH